MVDPLQKKNPGSAPVMEDSAFKEDFSVLPVFVPTDTLDHLKECGKATKKSTPGEAVAEMSSTKGLRLLPFVHDLQVSKPVDNNIIYVRALCWASYKKIVKYKVRIIVNWNGKPKIVAAQCDSKCLRLGRVAAVAMLWQ